MSQQSAASARADLRSVNVADSRYVSNLCSEERQEDLTEVSVTKYQGSRHSSDLFQRVNFRNRLESAQH